MLAFVLTLHMVIIEMDTNLNSITNLFIEFANVKNIGFVSEMYRFELNDGEIKKTDDTYTMVNVKKINILVSDMIKSVKLLMEICNCYRKCIDINQPTK